MSIPHLTLGVVLMVALMIPSTILAQPTASQAAPAPSAVTGSTLFIENAGQWPAAAHFQVWNSPLGAGTTWLAEDAIWVVVSSTSEIGNHPGGRGPSSKEGRSDCGDPLVSLSTCLPVYSSHALKLTFPGSNLDVRIEPFQPMTTTVSYFIGNDPEQWRRDVPVWGGVRYVDLYHGMDLVIGGPDGVWQLEASSGAKVEQVRVQVDGADIVGVNGVTLQLVVDGEVAVDRSAVGVVRLRGFG